MPLQVATCNSFSSGGTCWRQLVLTGYYVNAAKSWLTVKGESLAHAGQECLQWSKWGTDNRGRPDTLGTLIMSFTETLVTGKVSEWVCELKYLAEKAYPQP